MSDLTISSEIVTGIETIAKQFNLSVKELLENISKGNLVVINPEDLEDMIDLQDAIEAENNPVNQERVSWELIKQNLEINMD